MADSYLASQSEQSNREAIGQLLGIETSVLDSFAYNHNYAYIVTVILSQIGMNRTQNNIEDSGALQNEISKGQTQFATMQQFMALLEGNTQWDSNNKTAYWPGGFQSSHQDDMKNFANAFGQFFWNNGPNSDTSTTTTDLNIDVTLPSSFGKFPAGTQLIVNPCANEVLAQLPNGQSVNATSSFGGVLSGIRTYLLKVEGFVTGGSTIPAEGSSVPQYLAMAMANLQTEIDSKPEAFFTSCVNGTGSISSFAGAVDDNPLMTAAQSLYSEFNEAKGVNGSDTIAQDIQQYYETNETGSSDQLWNDMAGMMADWMQNKMANQSTSSGTSAPSGSIYIYPSGTQNSSAYLNGAKNNIGSAQHLFELMEVFGWGDFHDEMSLLSSAENDLNASPPNLSDAKAKIQQVLNDVSKCSGPYIGEIKSELQSALQDVNGYPTPISDPGLFNEVQSSLSMGSSTYQSQTQQNAANVQQDTSTLTSYDQIGQSIITAMNKSEETIAGNLKSS